MLNKEPALIIQAIQTIIVGALPVMMLFGIVNWSVDQFAAVETFVILVAGTIGGLFTRSQVTPYPLQPEVWVETRNAEPRRAA